MTIDAEFVQEIAQLADTAAIPTLVYGTDEDPHVSMVHLTNHHGVDELKIIDFEQYKPNPRRKKGTVQVFNVDSFVAYVKRHATDATEMFAKGEQVTAVLNHHSKDAAGWNDHRCVLTMQKTPAWTDWLAFTEKYMELADFAAFLEEHISAIVKPDAADVLDLVREMTIHSSAKFQNHQRPGDGTVQLLYIDEHTTTSPKGSIDFKDGFPMTIVLQAFEGAEEFEFQAKLRYKLDKNEGTLRFMLTMPGVREKFDQAVEARIQYIAGHLDDQMPQGVLRGALLS